MARWVNGGTPKQRAALRKAQEAAWRANKGRRRSHYTAKRNVNRRHYSGDANKRGVGVKGLAKNSTPYVRVNKRSQTAGFNTGTIIPFTGKRISFGGYFRLENTTRKNALDTALNKVGNKIARDGTKPGKVKNWFGKNVHIDNPGVRASVGGAQVRLGTSRGGGATIIVRRGKHKPFEGKSRAGIKKYNTRMRVIQKKKKKTRRARRGK